MKHISFYLFCTALVVVVSACGRTSTPVGADTVMPFQEQRPVETSDDNSFFEITNDSIFNATENIHDPELAMTPLFVPAGTTGIIIDETVDLQGRTWVRVGLETPSMSTDDARAEATIHDVWIAKDVFESADIQILNAEALEALRMTYCYKYVKLYLLKIGLVKEYLPGASAYMAATILPKYGFKKVKRKPSQAIVNDVCVYKGGPSGHGHIEILTSKGWYYGYGYKKEPIKNRIFIACFHK